MEIIFLWLISLIIAFNLGARRNRKIKKSPKVAHALSDNGYPLTPKPKIIPKGQKPQFPPPRIIKDNII